MANFRETPYTMQAPQSLVPPGFPARPPLDAFFGGNRSVQNFTPEPAGGGGNLTLDALMLRQKAAQAAQERNMSQPQGTILGGLGQVAGSIFNALEQRRAEREEGIANDEIAGAISQIPESGIPTSDILATVGHRDRDTMLQLLKMGIDSRQAAALLEAQKAKTAADTGPKLSDTASIADDYKSDPTIRSLQISMPMWDNMIRASQDNSAGADLNMVIALAKIYDPDSVVRTEEGKAVELTGNAPDSIIGQFKYLIGDPGARLSTQVRKDMLRQAQGRIQGYQSLAGTINKHYSERATRGGMNPADVVIPFPALAEYDESKVVGLDSPAPAGTPTPAPTPATPGTPDTPPTQSWLDARPPDISQEAWIRQWKFAKKDLFP